MKKALVFTVLITLAIVGFNVTIEAQAVIAPVNMNILYEGLENPVEVAVPGIASENIRIEVSNASFEKKGNQFMIVPRAGVAGTTATITVFAKTESGEQNMGEQIFRINRVPEPVAKINNQKEGKIRKETLLNQKEIVADMEGFLFDMKWTITSFRILTEKEGYISNSNLFTKEQIDFIRTLDKGQKIVIDNIRATGPGGRSRGLASIELILD